MLQFLDFMQLQRVASNDVTSLGLDFQSTMKVTVGFVGFVAADFRISVVFYLRRPLG